MRFTITATELCNGLANTLPFAGNEKAHPALNSVRLTTTGNGVLFTAGGRLAVAQVLAEPVLAADEQMESAVAVIPVKAAKSVLATSKGLLRGNGLIVIDIDGATLTVEDPEAGTATQYELREADAYPPVDALWPAAPVGAVVNDGVRQIEPALLAKLGAVRAHTLRPWNGAAAMNIGLGHTSAEPILATFRDWFRAVIRPLDQGRLSGAVAGVDPAGRFADEATNV